MVAHLRRCIVRVGRRRHFCWLSLLLLQHIQSQHSHNMSDVSSCCALLGVVADFLVQRRARHAGVLRTEFELFAFVWQWQLTDARMYRK